MIPALPQVGGTELLIVLFIILLLFGAKRIPQLAPSGAAPGSSARASPEPTTKMTPKRATSRGRVRRHRPRRRFLLSTTPRRSISSELLMVESL
jgi:hypothetical protein